jgi:acetoacetate decarboxylase
VLPGRTLGGLYLASYGARSSLQYHELIAVPALVRRGVRIGVWISHIYVDDAGSLAGGREIWGLPKLPARFELDTRGGTNVFHESQLLCRISAGRAAFALPVPVLAPAFACRGGHIVWFHGRGTARCGIARTELAIPQQSPLRALGLHSGRGLSLPHLDLLVQPPVEQKAARG